MAIGGPTGQATGSASRGVTETPGPPARMGVLRGCGLAAGIIALLVVGAGVLTYVQLTQSFKGPEGLPLDARWETWDVRLEPGHPVATGTLGLVLPDAAETIPNMSISVGLPVVDGPTTGNEAPAQVLHVPAVRVSIGSDATARSCLAPCELQLAAVGGTNELRVEALDAPMDAPVRVVIGAGIVGRVGVPVRPSAP